MSSALVLQAHGPLLDAVAAAESDVRLASPFMSAGVLHDLAAVARVSRAQWRVLTRLDAAAVAHGSLSTQGLRQLLDTGVELRSLTHLHAKVFICDPHFGLVGSANLTSAGLSTPGGRSNIELGVLLSTSQREQAAASFDTWWDAALQVDAGWIERVEEAARTVPASVPVMPAGPAHEGHPPATTTRANVLLAEAGRANLWVKAVYGDEVSADVALSDSTWFSSSARGRPSFGVGDLVLIYQAGVQRCNAVVEVTDVARNDPAFIVSQGRPQEDAERWPWVNDVTARLQVPVAAGVPLSHLGFTGQSLQGGHKRLGLSEFALAVRYMAIATASGTAAP